MTGGMRLSRRSSFPLRVFSSKWLRRSMRLFSVSTKVIARAASRESTSGRRFASSRRLAGGAVGCSRGLLLAGRGRLPSMGAAIFRLPMHAFLCRAGCVDSVYSAFDMQCFTCCSGVGFWCSSSRRLFGPIYVWFFVRGLSLLCFRHAGSLISQARGAALEAAFKLRAHPLKCAAAS